MDNKEVSLILDCALNNQGNKPATMRDREKGHPMDCQRRYLCRSDPPGHPARHQSRLQGTRRTGCAHPVMCCLAMGLCSEKRAIRRLCHCEHHRVLSDKPGWCRPGLHGIVSRSWATSLFSMLLYKTTRDQTKHRRKRCAQQTRDVLGCRWWGPHPFSSKHVLISRKSTP